MFVEHIFFTAAIAIIVGMMAERFLHRDHTWIIIASALAPDLDATVDVINFFKELLVAGDLSGFALTGLHGLFHNLLALFGYACILAFLIPWKRIPRVDVFIFAAIGFGAHLFEDALVYPPSYHLLWPLSSQGVGFALLPSQWNWYPIGNSETLMIGIGLACAAALLRTALTGTSWLPRRSGTVIKRWSVLPAQILLPHLGLRSQIPLTDTDDMIPGEDRQQ